MRYKLIAPVKYDDTVTQVLVNRGLCYNDIKQYVNATLNDVNSPEAFGKDKMWKAVELLGKHIKNNSKTIIIIDPDVDGNTSSALLLNYLYKIFPEWTEKVDFFFHKGKEHGLNDCYEYIIKNGYNFVLCPDAGSNDTEECKAFKDNRH